MTISAILLKALAATGMHEPIPALEPAAIAPAWGDQAVEEPFGSNRWFTLAEIGRAHV